MGRRDPALLPDDPPADVTTEAAIDAVRTVLAADPDVIAVVGPEFVDAVKDAMESRGWSDRVQSW